MPTRRHVSALIIVTVALCLVALAVVTLIPRAASETKPETTRGETPCCADLWRPGGSERRSWRPGGTRAWRDQRMHRHRMVMLDGIPLDYQGQKNPLAPTPDVVRKGGTLYLTECASCHGQRGLGDGDAGKGLSPSPALLAYLQKRPMAIDAYLMWTISEGGKPLASDMPAFKKELSEDEIWQVVAYMRAGFPSLAEIGGARN